MSPKHWKYSISGSFIFAFIFLYALNLLNPLLTLKSEHTDNTFQELVGSQGDVDPEAIPVPHKTGQSTKGDAHNP